MAEKTKQRRDALKGLDANALKDELTKLKKEQFNLRFQQATGTIEKAARIRVVRRDIARIKTLLAERKRAAASA